jgi:hypothetical protein
MQQRNRITEVNTAIRTEGNLDPEEVSSMSVLSSGFGAMHVGKETTLHTIVLGGWKEPITKRREMKKGRIKMWKSKVRRRRGPVHL